MATDTTRQTYQAEAVAAYLRTQPWYAKRKNTITGVAVLVMTLASQLLEQPGGLPQWAVMVITAVVGVCGVLVHAFTPGAVTPSMAKRLERAAASDGAYPPAPFDDLAKEILRGNSQLKYAIENLGHLVADKDKGAANDSDGDGGGGDEPAAPAYPSAPVGERS